MSAHSSSTMLCKEKPNYALLFVFVFCRALESSDPCLSQYDIKRRIQNSKQHTIPEAAKSLMIIDENITFIDDIEDETQDSNMTSTES
ncbi:CLUMA_CG017097, isoform A [Clunio marinus]|uniref:CLUMA_CG017097, isoform A n=1 Tax=Clunio marinus TaxID=568069 RepID=A0A1J1IV39_9DIPT|nr:CLUMA_CG017097, isoform A [Clunio marinus]